MKGRRTLHKETLAPEELLEELKIHANSRKRRSLEIIAEICSEQRERNSKDFSIATIGRLSTKAERPATQSIRNKTGGDYRALIKAWLTIRVDQQRSLPRAFSQPGRLFLIRSMTQLSGRLWDP